MTPWTVAGQAPLSMGFSRQEYWSGLPFPPPGDLPEPGIKPVSPGPLAFAGRFFTAAPPGKPGNKVENYKPIHFVVGAPSLCFISKPSVLG